MSNQTKARFWGVRAPMIRPVLALPGHVIMTEHNHKDLKPVVAVSYDEESFATITSEGECFHGDDMEQLEKAGVVERLLTAAELKLYGWDWEVSKARRERERTSSKAAPARSRRRAHSDRSA